MKTTIDTFIYLQRDIEQSFQRVQSICNSSYYDSHELDQILNHISCTLDDLQQINHLLNSTSANLENPSSNLLNLTEDENNFNAEKGKLISQKQNDVISITDKNFRVSYSKENEEPLLTSNSDVINTNIVLLPSFDERQDLIHRMKLQYDYYKNKIQPVQKKDSQMEIIQLDPAPEDQDHIIRQQDEHLEDLHHSIVSLKNLTQNINTEISSHLRVLDNLETGMTNSHSHIQSVTNQTKTFIRTSADSVGGHTCLFGTAVGLFFLIVILIIFF